MAAPKDQCETVVFNARFCGKKNIHRISPLKSPDVNDQDLPSTNKPPPRNTVFNIKRARYEIIRYGLSGFDKEEKMNAKIAMAIKLGAKPPKKKNINYKLLMEQKKKEKEEAAKNSNRSKFNLQPLKQKRKSSKKKKLKKQPNSLV